MEPIKYIAQSITCEQCAGHLSVALTEAQQEELTDSIIGVLKKYPIRYLEAYRVLDCVKNKLSAMADCLQL